MKSLPGNIVPGSVRDVTPAALRRTGEHWYIGETRLTDAHCPAAGRGGASPDERYMVWSQSGLYRGFYRTCREALTYWKVRRAAFEGLPGMEESNDG